MKQNKMPINSREQLLAADICLYAGDKDFTNYRKILGVITRIGIDRAYQFFSEMKQNDDKIKDRVALFMWKAKQINEGGKRI